MEPALQSAIETGCQMNAGCKFQGPENIDLRRLGTPVLMWTVKPKDPVRRKGGILP